KKTNGGVLISEAGGGIEIAKDVAPLRWSIESGVNDGEIAHLPLETQIAQPLAGLLAQLRPRPCHGALSHFIEIAGSFRLCRLLVVIPFHRRAIQIAHYRNALARVGIVTDDVAQTNEVSAVPLARVRQHCFEGLQIRMNVAKNGKPHQGIILSFAGIFRRSSMVRS